MIDAAYKGEKTISKKFMKLGSKDKKFSIISFANAGITENRNNEDLLSLKNSL